MTGAAARTFGGWLFLSLAAAFIVMDQGNAPVWGALIMATINFAVADLLKALAAISRAHGAEQGRGE